MELFYILKAVNRLKPVKHIYLNLMSYIKLLIK